MGWVELIYDVEYYELIKLFYQQYIIQRRTSALRRALGFLRRGQVAQL